MKKFTLSILLVWISCIIQLFAQDNVPQVDKDGVYMYTDQMPVYKGSKEERDKIIAENLKYPAEASLKQIEGVVLVQFVIGKKGNVSNFKVIRSIHPSLDEEALRVVKMLKKWIPGRHQGKPVSVRYNIPVNFKLSVPQKEQWDNTVDLVPKCQENASLQGVWQLCLGVDPLPGGKYRIKTAPVLKILSSDKTFINLYMNTMGNTSAITAMGTYQQTSDTTYYEYIFQSVTDPQLLGVKNNIRFEFVTKNILVLNYRMPGKEQEGKEMWVRVVQPKVEQPEIIKIL
ncbi:TonB family protein [Bacteroides acidifaciens]|uniref:TonB family protein n=1 Tax=Bacteroides acidifaciens TaxID=85831 RepID=UPI00242E72F1|nr:TonB family protein [Bacteroides acidifaciens]